MKGLDINSSMKTVNTIDAGSVATVVLHASRPDDPMSQPAVLDTEWDLIREFYQSLDELHMEECSCCHERWLDMKLIDGRCGRCRGSERRRLRFVPVPCPIYRSSTTSRKCSSLGPMSTCRRARSVVNNINTPAILYASCRIPRKSTISYHWCQRISTSFF
jgi:hypothetical protein